MKISSLNSRKKLKNYDIYVVPAIMRKCNGFVIEILTSQPERKILFNTISELVANFGYHLYSLRHKDGDMTEPKWVTSEPILCNRFGWFVSQDEMNINKDTEISLTKVNTSYLSKIENGFIQEIHYGSCNPINILDYLKNEEEIFKNLGDNNE